MLLLVSCLLKEVLSVSKKLILLAVPLEFLLFMAIMLKEFEWVCRRRLCEVTRARDLKHGIHFSSEISKCICEHFNDPQKMCK